MSREEDVEVAGKVMGWRYSDNSGRWIVPDAHPMSNMPSEVPYYTTDANDDYEILKHVRGAWFFSKRQHFFRELQLLISKRKVSNTIISWPDILIFYEPGDYSRAALETIKKGR